MKMTLKAAATLALSVPFSTTLLHAQTTGMSHPEEIPITTSPEGIAQPVVYTPTPGEAVYTPSTATALKVRAPEPAAVAPARPVLTASVTAPLAERTEDISPVDSDRTAKPFPLETTQESNVIMRVAGPGNELPVGTLLSMKLTKGLTTRSTVAGTEFEGEILEAVKRDDRVLIPAGSVIAGLVTEIHGGKRVSGAARMHLRPESVTLPDGVRYAISGQVIDTDQYKTEKVDEEGTIQRKDHGLQTAGVFALSAGSGAAAGALLGGWPGALVGAGVGLGVSTVVWLKQDRQSEIPTGTKLVFQLTKPMVFEER